MENCLLFSVNGNSLSEGMSVMQGINTHFPLFTPLAISTSITQSQRCSIIILVPLQRPFPEPACRFHNSITGHFIFSSISCCSNPDSVKEFRNSVRYVYTRSSSATVSAGLYTWSVPGKSCITCASIPSTLSFFSVSIAQWAT